MGHEKLSVLFRTPCSLHVPDDITLQGGATERKLSGMVRMDGRTNAKGVRACFVSIRGHLNVKIL